MIQYFVNKKEGTVVATFDNKSNGDDQYLWSKYLTRHVRKIFKRSDGFFRINETVYKVIYKTVGEVDLFYGIAQCSGDDTFDVEKGKELAKKRLLKKYYDTQENVMFKLYKIMSKTAKNFLDDFNASDNKAAKFKSEIDSFKE